MKPKLPLTLLKILDPSTNPHLGYVEHVKETNNLLTLQGINENSHYYFKIIKFEVRDGKEHYSTFWEPRDSYSIRRHGGWFPLEEVMSYLNSWLQVIADLSETITIFDNITVEPLSFRDDDQEVVATEREMDDRIDQIIQELKKLGLGHEIIFDEIQELKELYVKLSKKNWKQVLKGKLIDLALAKLIENDTLELIYGAVTGADIKQLG